MMDLQEERKLLWEKLTKTEEKLRIVDNRVRRALRELQSAQFPTSMHSIATVIQILLEEQ
jgi:hypothetical protein